MRISDWSSDVALPICATDQLRSSRGRGRFHDRLNIVPSSSARNRLARKGGPAKIALSISDRKSTRLNPVTNAHLVCRLLLEKKKKSNKRYPYTQHTHITKLYSLAIRR